MKNNRNEQPEDSRNTRPEKKKRSNMHEGIADWCDCCPCEAEPRWRKVAEELGIDMSDYEDESSE